MPKGTDNKVLAQNRKANHDYTILDTIEAGLVLTGTEIKSVRQARMNLKDGYCSFKNGEAFLAKVMEDGFIKLSSENQTDNEDIDKEHPYVLVIGREDAFENIDEIVWYLMDLAEEFDGEYSGWGCHIVK